MKEIINDIIEKAIYYRENLGLKDESRELLQFVGEIIDKLASTYNAPSDWQRIGCKIAEEYAGNSWVYDELELWNYAE